jgi:hypothetical protein
MLRLKFILADKHPVYAVTSECVSAACGDECTRTLLQLVSGIE